MVTIRVLDSPPKFKGLSPWCADPFSVFGNKSFEAEATHAAMGKAKVSAGPKIQSIEGSRLFEAEAKRADLMRKTDRFAAAKRSVCCFH